MITLFPWEKAKIIEVSIRYTMEDHLYDYKWSSFQGEIKRNDVTLSREKMTPRQFEELNKIVYNFIEEKHLKKENDCVNPYRINIKTDFYEQEYFSCRSLDKNSNFGSFIRNIEIAFYSK